MKLYSHTLLQATFGIGLALLIGFLSDRYQQNMRNREPAEAYFNVLKIAVPDFEEGQDPVVLYDPEPKVPAKVTRVVEIVRANDPDGVPVCTGRDVVKYDGDQALPKISMRLSEFVGTFCHLMPGKYVPKGAWLVKVEGTRTKRLRRVGDPFTVLPKGAKDYITTKQIEQLEKAEELLDNPIPIVPSPPQ